MSIKLRSAGHADAPSIQRGLYLALTWDGGPPGITFDRAMSHDAIRMYHEDWGRAGDIGVIAEQAASSIAIGVAYGRLFSEDLHGHGYVDGATPEIAVAVEPEHIGRGIGTRLIAALEDAYRQTSVAQLSLSVHLANPALRLYQRLNYVEVNLDESSSRMVKVL